MAVIAGSGEAECLERLEEVADLYVEEAIRVRRLVCLCVHAADPVIDDACQTAWTRLIHHRARVRRESATRWLVRVAVHEAFRLLRHGTRDLSLDELAEADGPPALGAPRLMEELAEQRARLDAIRSLPARQQRLVWLHGLGFTYEEMAGETGDSRRTVERQLTRARAALAQTWA